MNINMNINIDINSVFSGVEGRSHKVYTVSIGEATWLLLEMMGWCSEGTYQRKLFAQSRSGPRELD